MWTGIQVDGGFSPDTCNSWQSNQLTPYRALTGQAHSARLFTAATTTYCTQQGHILCVGYGTHPKLLVAPVPASARRVFLSQPYAADVPADARCRQEASAAGLPRPTSYIALRSQADGGASGNALIIDGGQWYRVDGMEWVGENRNLVDGGGLSRRTIAPLNVTSDGGKVLVYTSVWTGGSPISTYSNTCTNWTQTTTSYGAAGNALSSGTDAIRATTRGGSASAASRAQRPPGSTVWRTDDAPRAPLRRHRREPRVGRERVEPRADQSLGGRSLRPRSLRCSPSTSRSGSPRSE